MINRKPAKIAMASVAIIVAIGVLFGSLLIYGRMSSMSAMRLEHPDRTIGPLPLSLTGAVELLPGMPFRIDTGSSVNTISHKYINMLKSKGFDVDSSTVLSYVTTGYGAMHCIATKRYRVTLPVYSYDISRRDSNIVSLIDTTNLMNRIDGVDFVLTPIEREIPRLGRPFLRRFVMEYTHDLRALKFHTSVPDGYEPLTELNEHFTIFRDPPIYMTMDINGRTNDYFFNTAMPRVGVLMPPSLAPMPDGVKVFRDTIPSVYGRIPVTIDYSIWVRLDDRGGNNVGYYSDYGSEDYALNPFNFFTQDAVIDLTGKCVYLHPFSERSRRMRSNDAFTKN